MLASAALVQDDIIMEPIPIAYANQALTRKYRGIDVEPYVLSFGSPQWLPAVLTQLEEFSRLEAGWDSYDAKAISTGACDAAYIILRELVTRSTPIPSVVPMSDGRIQFEWHTNDIDLEVRVSSTTKIEVFFEDSRGVLPPMEDVELRYDFREVKRAIDLLSAR